MEGKKRPKYGGRKAGTPNKVNRDLRTRIGDFIDGNFDEAVQSWRTMEPRDKVRTYIDLCAFVLPKLQAVQLDANISHQSSIEDDLRTLSEETDYLSI